MGQIIYLPNGAIRPNQSLANILHDMASPLSALETASGKLENLSELDKKMIQSATTRLKDLLNKYRNSPERTTNKFLIKDTILEAIKEKEYEYKAKIGVLELQTIDHLYVLGDEVEFRRLFSNLINNSFEALVGSDIKRINVILSLKGTQLRIDISDNGIGLTQDQIEKILCEQQSYKHKGPGLGVGHARATIESWGGEFSMKSNKVVGTTVSINLPVMKSLRVL